MKYFNLIYCQIKVNEFSCNAVIVKIAQLKRLERESATSKS